MIYRGVANTIVSHALGTLQMNIPWRLIKLQKFIKEGDLKILIYTIFIFLIDLIEIYFYDEINTRLKDVAQKQYSQVEAELGAGRVIEKLPPVNAGKSMVE